MAFVVIAMIPVLAACSDEAHRSVADESGPTPTLDPPHKRFIPIPLVNIAPAKGWPAGVKPTPAAGLQVQDFASGLDHPRWLYVLPNGDVLVAETNAPSRPQEEKGLRAKIMGMIQKRAGSRGKSADRITLLRDANGDGIAETRAIFIDHLTSPFGMVLVGNDFYVADTDAVLKFPYQNGMLTIKSQPQKVADLPAGPRNHHWTKNITASPDGAHLYVTVGSNSNAAENGIEAETSRAAILEIDPSTGQSRVYASGLRNPQGMGWEPTTGALWVAVNERDELGGDLVPDYITSVKEGGFYGWPYSYFGRHVDERVKPQRPDLVATALVPDYAVGAHTASLGFAFSRSGALPAGLSNGAFVSQHGSWNRKPKSGYKVIYVPFANGRPIGMPQDVLTGFLDQNENALGRPVGIALDSRGALLVADDVGNHIWRVTAGGMTTASARAPAP
jgi:glucose/arabinose dehydrogenase